MRHTTRRHPVGRLLNDAALGHVPAADELDALGLSPGTRREVAEHARQAVAIKADGRNLEARRYAAEHAQNLIDELPEEQQDPDYLKPPDDSPTDPASLAAQVTRW